MPHCLQKECFLPNSLHISAILLTITHNFSIAKSLLDFVRRFSVVFFTFLTLNLLSFCLSYLSENEGNLTRLTVSPSFFSFVINLSRLKLSYSAHPWPKH